MKNTKRILPFKGNEKGSLTLESTIVLPIVLILFLAIVQIFNLYSTKVLLQSTVSETVKQLAGNWIYMIKLNKHAPTAIQTLLHTSFVSKLGANRVGTIKLIKLLAEPRLKTNDIKITKLKYPSHLSKKVTLCIQYPYMIQLPFIKKKFRLQASATETVWSN
jgi:competence protein ComGC